MQPPSSAPHAQGAMCAPCNHNCANSALFGVVERWASSPQLPATPARSQPRVLTCAHAMGSLRHMSMWLNPKSRSLFMVAGAPQAANGPWSPETVVNTSRKRRSARKRASAQQGAAAIVASPGCWARGQNTAQAFPHPFALAILP